jgi:hypothetical protein
MRYCEACRAEIPEGYDECPFCNIQISDEDTEEFIEVGVNVIGVEQQVDDEDE